MTFEQYWNEDCCLTKYYRKAYEISRDRKNWEAWLQGMYIYEALCDVSPLLRAFAKNGTKADEYASEPYALTSKQIEDKKKTQEQQSYELGMAKMTAFQMRFNKKFEERGNTDDGNHS